MGRIFVRAGLGGGLVLFGFLLGIVLSNRHVLSYPFASAAYHELLRVFTRESTVPTEADAPILCFGDSMTSGYLASRNANWPDRLSVLFHRRTVNLGVPKQTSTQIRERFLARPRAEGPEFVIIWAGRNNAYEPEVVLADIAAMVASLNPGSRYLVLGISNAATDLEQRGGKDHALLSELNRKLQQAYGPRYVPVREALLARANPRFAADRADVAQDVVPSSLRLDRVHLNDAGQAIVAMAVNDAIIANHW